MTVKEGRRAMEVEVLGPLTVRRDGEWLEFEGPREQAVLNAAVEARRLRMRRLTINKLWPKRWALRAWDVPRPVRAKRMAVDGGAGDVEFDGDLGNGVFAFAVGVELVVRSSGQLDLPVRPGTRAEMIISTSAIHDHFGPRLYCNDTPASSIAGRSYQGSLPPRCRGPELAAGR